MSSMAFVTVYMTVMDLQSHSIRNHMWAHLRDLMHDGECFGWPTVRNRKFHAVWLQHMEQGTATWGDEVTRLDLRRSLVWQRPGPSFQPSPPPVCTPQAPTQPLERTVNPHVAHPEHRACLAFNLGLSSFNVGHPADLHVYSYCFTNASRLWSHPEVHCHHKNIAKNGSGGPRVAVSPPLRGNPPSSACQTQHQATRGQVAAQLSRYRATHPTCYINTATSQYRQQ